MKKCSFIGLMFLYYFIILLQSRYCTAGVPFSDTMNPGNEASQMGFIDNDGVFLESKDSTFALGFQPTTQDVTLILLVILHKGSSTVVWTANHAYPVGNSDSFVFDSKGNVSLQSGGKSVWAPDTGGKPGSFIQLLNSGNMALIGVDNTTIWDSFSHPTDTLLSNQDFKQGMKLLSFPKPNGGSNLTYSLEVQSGHVRLYALYDTPQIYWSITRDSRKIINQDGGEISLARIEENSWRFFDENNGLLLQLVFSSNPTILNSTWIAVLESDGFLSFYSLGSSKTASSTKVPRDQCGTPERCEPFEACASNRCYCPSGLVLRSCKTGISSPCRAPNGKIQLINAGDGLRYSALEFAQPALTTNLNGCKASCVSNCSCLALFFDNSSGSCYFFDRLGSFVSDKNSKYSAFVKVSMDGYVGVGENNTKNHLAVMIVIVIVTLIVVLGIAYGGYRYYFKTKLVLKNHQEALEEDNFLDVISGMPVRYTYKDLQDATNDFLVKLGHGGFGSVYKGMMPDGTLIAVKKLEGVGQGKKEFRAEVSIIGGIHHVHLVRLKGFCAEGSHRLLAYEFMANGSLDKWIFNNHSVLDWKTRFSIAVGTAKGLAYLHEDCDMKIVHCDIKPENVLLDEHFEAKVSDFGLAKLMTREQSIVVTTLRGTRGYLAPEWITNYAISEKSDVYSYGMVLLEIIGGRKSYDSQESPEKSHFPAYAFKKMEEGKVEEILDSTLKYDPNDESVCNAIKVALWCIQEDMAMRPPMTKVVQMLEGIFPVPHPPTSSLNGSRLFSSFFRSMSNENGTGTGTGTFAELSDYGSNNYLSDMRLSGPR